LSFIIIINYIIKYARYKNGSNKNQFYEKIGIGTTKKLLLHKQYSSIQYRYLCILTLICS